MSFQVEIFHCVRIVLHVTKACLQISSVGVVEASKWHLILLSTTSLAVLFGMTTKQTTAKNHPTRTQYEKSGNLGHKLIPM